MPSFTFWNENEEAVFQVMDLDVSLKGCPAEPEEAGLRALSRTSGLA